jgi:drug/metabolite transporter (DMT)-like permease
MSSPAMSRCQASSRTCEAGLAENATRENPHRPSIVPTSVSRRHSLMLLVLASLWGASFMFIKVGVRELAPGTLICFRLALGAMTVLPVALVTLGRRELARSLRAAAGPLFLVGLINSALPITVLAWGEKRVDSGLAAVIQASAPLFTALLALRFSRGEVVTGSRFAGLLVGFGGVALLVGVQPRGDVLSALAITFTALCYAAAALYSARALAHVPPLVTAVGALASATLILVPFAIAQPPHGVPGWKVTGSLLALGILGTGVAYVLYYALLAGAGASRAILITYLSPALALGYGAIFLGEAVTASAVVGLALVLGGVALGTGVARPLRRRAPVASPP